MWERLIQSVVRRDYYVWSLISSVVRGDYYVGRLISSVVRGDYYEGRLISSVVRRTICGEVNIICCKRGLLCGRG